jgi:zinc protease
MAKFHWTEIDHVTTVWTEAPPPLQAGLLFRTGIIDESLFTRGVTHLIEHIAFSADAANQLYFNGQVDAVRTGFFAVGKDHDVLGFLADICNTLTLLPGDRLAEEKQVLAAEASSRSYDLRTNLLVWRYGVSGHGLQAFPEFGLHGATLEQLRTITASRFTSDNAVLWLSGPPPKGLKLNLPRGTKQAIPMLTPIQQQLPCWFLDNRCGGIAASAIVPRSYSATVFYEIVRNRLFNKLRLEKAISYAPSVSYIPLNAEVAEILFYADSEQSRRAELGKEFGEVFQGLSEIESAEFDKARKQVLSHINDYLAFIDAGLSIIHAAKVAEDWVFSYQEEPLKVRFSKLKSLKLEDIKSFARAVQANAIFALPGGTPLLDCYGVDAGISEPPIVKGFEAKLIDDPNCPEKLIFGPDGVSFIPNDRSHLTINYPDLAGAISYEDGGIDLLRNDGSHIMVEPTLWRGGKFVCQEIREKIPAGMLIDNFPRPENSIPKPRTTTRERLKAYLHITDTAILYIFLLLIFMCSIMCYSYIF